MTHHTLHYYWVINCQFYTCQSHCYVTTAQWVNATLCYNVAIYFRNKVLPYNMGTSQVILPQLPTGRYSSDEDMLNLVQPCKWHQLIPRGERFLCSFSQPTPETCNEHYQRQVCMAQIRLYLYNVIWTYSVYHPVQAVGNTNVNGRRCTTRYDVTITGSSTNYAAVSSGRLRRTSLTKTQWVINCCINSARWSVVTR